MSPDLKSVPGRDRQTDRRTDRIAIANARSQQYLPVHLSRVKTVSVDIDNSPRGVHRAIWYKQLTRFQCGIRINCDCQTSVNCGGDISSV